MATYDKGELVRLSAAFVNPAGEPTDPTTITLEVKPPSGIVAVVTPVREGTGAYYYDLDIVATGTWYYHWEGTGAVQTAGEASLRVRATQF